MVSTSWFGILLTSGVDCNSAKFSICFVHYLDLTFALAAKNWVSSYQPWWNPQYSLQERLFHWLRIETRRYLGSQDRFVGFHTRRRRTALSVSRFCPDFPENPVRCLSTVRILSGFCPDSVCLDSVRCPDSVRISRKKAVRCLSVRIFSTSILSAVGRGHEKIWDRGHGHGGYVTYHTCSWEGRLEKTRSFKLESFCLSWKEPGEVGKNRPKLERTGRSWKGLASARWVSNFIPKKTKKFKFEKNCMAMLFSIKNNH